MTPTPTAPDREFRPGGFASIAEALDFAARQPTGINLYSLRGELAQPLTYRELREGALRLAGRLLAAGLEPGDRVGLVAESDADFLTAFFACQYAGLAPAPLPLPAPFGGREAYVEHLRRMLQSAEAKAVFGPASLGEWLTEASEGLDLRLFGPIGQLEGAPEAKDLPGADPDGLCYLQFSSGSTRFPLGVAVTQKALMANLSAQAQHGLQVTPHDRPVSWLPLYHDMGLIGFMMAPLACQLSLDLLPTGAFVRRPLLWLDLISRHRATISYSPTFGYELCARRAESISVDGLDLSTWRVAGIGGDMIRPPVLQAFAERFEPVGFDPGAFLASYGMAEATLALSFSPLGRGVRAESLDVDRLERDGVALGARARARAARVRDFALNGPPIPGHELQVRADDGRPQPERRVGRIFARGPSLMQAYFGQPEETSRVLSEDGWLDTGDLGYFSGGEIVITGRAKDLIIVNGRNVWPQDLEWTAEAETEGLRSGDVAVFSVPGDGEETVVALVQCRTSDPDARARLREHIAGALRLRHGLETEVVLAPPHSLPKTSSGKLSRSRARALYQSGVFAPDPAAVSA
jgi:fatty-acyl-CoA synthase